MESWEEEEEEGGDDQHKKHRKLDGVLRVALFLIKLKLLLYVENPLTCGKLVGNNILVGP
jgi:hypothetical protein